VNVDVSGTATLDCIGDEDDDGGEDDSVHEQTDDIPDDLAAEVADRSSIWKQLGPWQQLRKTDGSDGGSQRPRLRQQLQRWRQLRDGLDGQSIAAADAGDRICSGHRDLDEGGQLSQLLEPGPRCMQSRRMAALSPCGVASSMAHQSLTLGRRCTLASSLLLRRPVVTDANDGAKCRPQILAFDHKNRLDSWHIFPCHSPA